MSILNGVRQWQGVPVVGVNQQGDAAEGEQRRQQRAVREPSAWGAMMTRVHEWRKHAVGNKPETLDYRVGLAPTIPLQSSGH